VSDDPARQSWPDATGRGGVGGSPSGATVAKLVAQQGHSVQLLEREHFPRYHIGESLIPETFWVLERLGMLDKLRGSRFVDKHSVQFVSEQGRLSQPFYFADHKPQESSRTWQERLSDLADGDPTATFAFVAFDDKFRLISDKLYAIDFVKRSGGDLGRLASRKLHDGRAAWEYSDDGNAAGRHCGTPRIRLLLSPHTRRLLTGMHRGWDEHLKLGTNNENSSTGR
jgi:hypothetical protein